MVTVPSSSKCVYFLLVRPLPERPEEPRRMPLAEVFEGGGALTVTLTSETAEAKRVVERGGDGGGRRVTLGVATGVQFNRHSSRP